jgi:hypothetical protein
MLAAGTLEEVDSVYEQGTRKILRHKLNYYLKLFGEKYSSFLHSIVMGLLADNPADRKRCSEIYSTLYEYEDKILDLESFLPNNSRLSPFPQQPAPQSIQQQSPFQSQPHIIVQQQHPIAMHNGRPIFQEQLMQGRPASYFLPNTLVVNPIESKYIPVSPVHGQPIGVRPEQERGFRASSGPSFPGRR